MNTKPFVAVLRALRPLLPQSIRIFMARRWMRIGQRRAAWAKAIAPEIATDEQSNGE